MKSKNSFKYDPTNVSHEMFTVIINLSLSNLFDGLSISLVVAVVGNKQCWMPNSSPSN